MSLIKGAAYGELGAFRDGVGGCRGVGGGMVKLSRRTTPSFTRCPAASSMLQWLTPLAPATALFVLTDGAAALADLVSWHDQQRGAGGRLDGTALAYIPSAVLPRIDAGRNARVEWVDGSRPALWLTRVYLLQARSMRREEGVEGAFTYCRRVR